MDITKFAIPEIIFGRGSLDHAGQCALRLGARKVFLVSDEGIEQAGWLQRLRDILEREGIRWVYYPGVTPNPRDFQIEQGAEFYLKNDTDVIIVGVSAMLLCFLATLYPARQAARLEPAEALRYE